jgi:hypothetical protein
VTEIVNLREKCGQCGHPFSLHGKAFGMTCRAMGCKGGEQATRCTGFVRAKESAALSATV